MKRTLPVIFATLAWCVAAIAHQDTALTLGPNGEILNLPQEYSSTRLVIEPASTPPGTLAALTFTSSGRTTALLPCVLSLVQTPLPVRPSLLGSWYHREDNLPHYVTVQFAGAEGAAHVIFIFSLRNAELLKVWRIPEPGQILVLTIKDGCPVTGS